MSYYNKIIAGFVLSLILVCGIGFMSIKSINSLKENAESVTHTHQVLGSIADILKSLIDAETGQRGYLITFEDKYLDPYREGSALISPELNNLKVLTRDNFLQQKRMDTLCLLINERTALLSKTIGLAKEEGKRAEAIAILKNGQGKALMDKIRFLCSRMESTEESLLEERALKVNEAISTAITVIVVGTIVILIIVISLIVSILTTFGSRRRAEKKLISSNKELEELSERDRRQNWLLSGSNRMNEIIRGEKPIAELCDDILKELAFSLSTPVGAFYLVNHDDSMLELKAQFALGKEHLLKSVIPIHQGLIGEAIKNAETAIFDDVPANYFHIQSAIGEIAARCVAISPLVVSGKVIGVIEIGSTKTIDGRRKEYLENVLESVTIAIHSAIARVKMQELYEETQQQAEELESQQEELRQTNEEIIEQTKLIQASEEELRVQQEELRQTNMELEKQAQLLTEKNEAIEQAREAIALKAEELTLSSKYKSEFLANMSHELRTPLNSVLILAKLLADNGEKNLTDKQVEFAKVINKSGNDLLNLINDILDLSKIESGKLDIDYKEIHLSSIEDDMKALFEQVASQKSVVFETDVDKSLKTFTDRGKLEQVVKNLLSNAFKFTPKDGKVTLRVQKSQGETTIPMLAISISDTGIGIDKSKHDIIFEAFKQADGSTTRKYGGTGLGLSISKELVKLLGGSIELDSAEGKGSTFTVLLPIYEQKPVTEEEVLLERKDANEAQMKKKVVEKTPPTIAPGIIAEGSRTILVVEDDQTFAKVIGDFAEQKGYKSVLAHTGEDGLLLAAQIKPRAIILDMNLPEMDGWTVLKKLKENNSTKDIPVQIISGMDRSQLAFDLGAVSYLRKPVTEEQLNQAFQQIGKDAIAPRVLIIEDDLAQSQSIAMLLESREDDIVCDIAATAEEAYKLLRENRYDCIITDLDLEDANGTILLEKIRQEGNNTHTPAIVYTGKNLKVAEEQALKKLAEAIVIKGESSYERLMSETALFLHKIDQEHAEQPVVKKSVTHVASKMDELLSGCLVLLADDDMRNVFAISTLLEQQGCKVIAAADGREAVDKFEQHPEINIVLMDIMMPEMNGYEAMKHIRMSNKTTPIIALTAKAMQGDREAAIESGASDYITKPVNTEQLLSLMRVWLYK